MNCRLLVLTWAFLFLGLVPALSHELIINEVMASNAVTLADEDGDYEDWVELYNYGIEAINLEGFGLSDDHNDLFRWYFPDVVISPGEYLLVWASGKNRKEPGKPLHTGFSISSAGEEVLLTSPDGTLVDGLEPTNIPTDISIGRLPDDLSGWYFFDNPTPGSANTTTSWSGIQEPPAFSHQRGFYHEPFSLSLSANDADATIYFTLDGSEPDPANLAGSTFTYKNQYPQDPGDEPGPFLQRSFQTHLYTQPIPIEDKGGDEDGIHGINTSYTVTPLFPQAEVMQGMVVRARAYREGFLPSPVSTNTYLVQEDIHERFDMPVLAISLPDTALFDYYRGIYVGGKVLDGWREDNPDEEIWAGVPANWWMRGDEWERRVHFEMFDSNGSTELIQNLGVRIHGGWSRSNPKKSLRLYARNIYDTNNEINHVFFPGDGRPLDGEDTGTFKRLMLRAGGNGMRMIRDVVSQDLMWNTNIGVQRAQPAVHFVNGVYWGLVNFRDRQDRYHIAYEYDVDPDNVIMIDSPYELTSESKLEEGVPEDLDFFNDLYHFITLNSLSNDSLFRKVEAQMDIDSYIDYYISFIYLANSDWGGRDHVGAKHFRFWRVRETSLKPYQDGRWRMLVWDFDSGFSDYNYDLLTDVMDPENEPSEIILNLMENEGFKHRFINRFADLMNTNFLPAHALEVLDRRFRAIESEIPHDTGRWNRHPSPSLDHKKNFINGRPRRQRVEMMNVFWLPDTSEVTLKTNPSRGSIRINTINITADLPGVQDPANWTGTYFHGVPVEIEAIAKPGMVFSHWEGLPEGTPARTILYLEQDTVLTAHFWDGVIHYWHFNHLPDDDIVESVNADYSLFPDDALITYPGEGPGYMDRVYPGTDLNAHMDAGSGYGLRVRNPSNTRSLIFEVPSTGYHNLGFSYALQRTNHGAQQHTVYYSPDKGHSWQQIASGEEISTDFSLHAFDLGPYEETNDNPDLHLRILFTDDAASNFSGNTRFDNIVLKVTPLELPSVNPPPGRISEAYEHRLTARYGERPYRFDVVKGSLPEGLTLSEDGTVRGMPAREGSFVFEVEVTDAGKAHARQEYILTIFGNALIHYWHFNDLDENVPDTVHADFSVTGTRGYLYYHGISDGYMDAVEGTAVNTWSGVTGGSGLRVRNPAYNRELRFKAPSDGFDYLQLSYAVRRTNNGAQWQLLQFSPDGGQSWISAGPPYRVTTDYGLKTFDLRTYPETADNSRLMFRIFFMGEEATNTSGNNRFDNVALQGVVAHDFVKKNELFAFPNPVTNGVIYFLETHSVSLYDTFGRRILRAEEAMKIMLPPLASGVYFIITDDGQHAKILVP